MGKQAKKKKVTVPKMPWDTGPNTLAQNYMRVIEDANYTDPETGKKVNPNGVRRARRIDWAELYHSKGVMTKRQLRAADALVMAWERTFRTPPAIKKVQVDVSPRPDAAISMQIDRVSKYHRLAKEIPKRSWPYVRHVVVDNRPLSSMAKGGAQLARYMDRMKDGLDALADFLGY